MHRLAETIISGVTAAALALAQIGPAAAGATISPAPDYSACQATDDPSFRSAIEAITVKALTDGLKNVDYQAAVTAQWRRIGLDAVLDKRVDLAVAEVRDESSWGSLIKSLADQQRAQELATAVAERVYHSDDVKKAIESLAEGVGQEIGKNIELALHDAATPALACLKVFLGPRYGNAVSNAVLGDASQQFNVDPNEASASISPGTVLKQSSQGITGTAILIMRRQLANMAQRLGQRLAGSVLARLVSVVAGGVGLVLIAKDIWDLRHGVLPIISDEMKSKETKEKVRAELAGTLEQEIGQHVKEIAANSAEQVLNIWQEFRRAHMKALELAEQHSGFRAFLDSITSAELPRLDEVTAIVLTSEGEAGVLKRVEDGTLSEAVSALPEPGMAIARETRSIETALAWQAIAGDDLGHVVEHEMHRRTRPDNFSSTALKKLLALDDNLAITRLSGIDRSARDVLFDLEPRKLTSLARNLADSELTSLAGYLTGLQQGPRERVLAAVAESPDRMRALASGNVRTAIVASANQTRAVDMMLATDATSIDIIADDFTAAWEGQVAPSLIWHKHPVAVGLLALVMLMIALWLRRLLRPPPRAPSAPHIG